MLPSHDLALCNKSFTYVKFQEECFDRHIQCLQHAFCVTINAKMRTAVSNFVMFFNAVAGNLKDPSIKVGSEGLILLQYRSR